MKVGARELRARAARVLEEVRRGSEVTVTYRNVPIAVIKPTKTNKRKARRFESIGFGMWANRKDLEDVEAWISKIRRPRYLG